MGAVFRARQESLGRFVALKVIRADALYSPNARERFRREIEAVAALRSPGIVPVHTVGEEGGVPFYAMELIEGINLAQLVADLRARPVEKLIGVDLLRATERGAPRPTGGSSAGSEGESLWTGRHVQACCRIALRVARALAHAHERGILHRDVKPNNVMLDASGRVLLLDFGLARGAERGTEALTQIGAAVGSLAYMAPEQVRGEADLDARVDVYGLGATLYELLTLQRPFRAVGDVEALRVSILAGQPVSPTQLNPAVDRDAETICLRAMAPEASRRYPTMAAMADDLQRFLELRPIQARRAGAVYRARRWVQRHPARATALGAALLVAVGGPTTIAIQQHDAAAQIGAALAETRRYQASYEQLLGNALETIKQTTYRLVNDERLATGALDRLRRDLLEHTLAFYEYLSGVEDASPAARDQLLRARSAFASVRKDLGEIEAARAVGRDVLACYEADLAAADADRRMRLLQRVAQAARALAELDVAAEDYRAAALALDRSVEATRAFAAQAGTTPPLLVQHLIDARMMRAGCRAALGAGPDAVAEYRAIVAELLADPARVEADAEWRSSLIYARGNLAGLLLRIGEFAAAEAELRAQVASLEAATAVRGDPDVVNVLRSSLHNLASELSRRGEHAAAEPLFTRAEGVARDLATAYPDRREMQRCHARSSVALAECQALAAGGEAGVDRARAAVESLARLAAAGPADVASVRELAEARGGLGRILLRVPAARAEAIASLEAAVVTLRELGAAERAGVDVIAQWGQVASTLSGALALDAKVRARALADEALTAHARAMALEPGNPLHRRQLATTLVECAADALAAGDEAWVRSAVQRGGLTAEDVDVADALARLSSEPAAAVRRLFVLPGR